MREIDSKWAKAARPMREPAGHKGTFGKVYVLGGSVGYTGAPVFAANAAQRAGCGLVFLGVPEGIYPIVAAKCDSVMPRPLPQREGRLAQETLGPVLEESRNCDVLAMGCGAGRGRESDRLLRRVLKEVRCPVVLDADGINALVEHIDALDVRRGRVTILTPHEGEFARLTGQSIGHRMEQAKAFAAAHGCLLVLKGPGTLVTDGVTVYQNTTGNSGMAKGGSGDVLCGLIAGLLAQGMKPLEAAALGVWLHGRAGDLAAQRLTEYAMTPADLLADLPNAWGSIIN